MNSNSPLTYRDAGVDIDAGEELVSRIKPAVKRTLRPEILSGLGGFGAICELPKKYSHPVLVSGTDGVGTKLKLAMELGKHDTVGIDLVAMCVNDIVVCGAEPLQFLDYYATGALDVDNAADVISGIAEGCVRSGCALVGGETAEMPGMYEGGDYDLAGFCVGIVEKNNIIDGRSVSAGDQLIGLGSSGLHSNGFSLVRKLVEREPNGLNHLLDERTPLGEALLEPTRIYVKPLLELAESLNVHAMAHITGGGLTENLPRVLPHATTAKINLESWSLSTLFRWLKSASHLDDTEMLRTFNCGIGMIVVVARENLTQAMEQLKNRGEQVFHLGEIVESDNAIPSVIYSGKLQG